MIAIVRPRRPWAARLAHSSPAIRASAARSSRRIADVAVEGPLARLGDHLAGRAYLPVVLEARAPGELAPEVGPEALDEQLLGRAAHRARACSGPSSARRAAVFGPMPGTRPGGAEAKRAQACSRLSTTKPAGFSASDATFATSLFGPMPTEQVSCRRLADLGHQPAHRRARREQALQVEVGLVQPHDLHALHVRAHDPHHPRGDLAIGGEVRRQEHGVRTQPPRPARRASPSRRRSGAPRSWRSSPPRAGRCPPPPPACRAARDGVAARSTRRTRRRRGARRAVRSSAADTAVESSAGSRRPRCLSGRI